MHEMETAGGSSLVAELMHCERCGGDDLQMVQMDFFRRHHRHERADDVDVTRRAVAADYRCNDCGCEFRSLRLAAR